MEKVRPQPVEVVNQVVKEAPAIPNQGIVFSEADKLRIQGDAIRASRQVGRVTKRSNR